MAADSVGGNACPHHVSVRMVAYCLSAAHVVCQRPQSHPVPSCWPLTVQAGTWLEAAFSVARRPMSYNRTS